MNEIKICVFCRKPFPRPEAYSATQWELRRFCNHTCHGLFQRKERRAAFEQFFVRTAETECWEWIGGRHGKGYGQFGNPTKKAHRVSWELYRGSIPDGLHVLNSCDNPPCINPSHLFLGTNLDNVKDKMAKGRGRNLRGEDTPWSIVTEEAVRRIREDKRSQSIIAAEFGIAQTTVSAIKRRVNWNWLT